MEEYTGNGKENEKKQRNRFMGKLFKETKKPTSQVEVDNFLHGTTENILMVPANLHNLPPLSRIDTSATPNFMTWERQGSKRTCPKIIRKSLVVRFSDAQPELIGEGGELAETPTANISLRKMTKSDLPPHHKEHNSTKIPALHNSRSGNFERSGSADVSHSGPLRHTQSLFVPNTSRQTVSTDTDAQERNLIGDPLLNSTGDQHSKADRRSFSQKVKDEMRSGEGMTLVASRKSIVEGDIPGSHVIDGIASSLEELHLNTMSNAIRSGSARPLTPDEPLIFDQILPKRSPPRSYQISQSYPDRPSTESKPRASPLPEAGTNVDEDTLNEFSKRTAHLSMLFRSSAEASNLTKTCPLESLVRAGIWWFLKGRMNLETTVRDRPVGAQAQKTNLLNLNQAYMDLAKSLWIMEVSASKFSEKELRSAADHALVDTLDARQAVKSGLRKLTISMKRNNFLPPDTNSSSSIQGLDSTLWVQSNGDKSLIVGQRLPSLSSLSASLPLGDTTNSFHYGRIFAEAVLSEEGTSQCYRCPVLLSLIRNHKEKSIQAIIANQDGSLNFAIQSDKAQGPSWADVRWHARKFMVEVRLPRGFFLCLYCSELDFGTFWRIYDYEKRIYAALSQRPDEDFVFETILKSFQHLDDIQHPNFKEPQSYCHMRLFKKSVVEKAATGPRVMYRGFRIALVTSPTVKTLRGVDLDIFPDFPIEFSFLRGDDGFPALLLRIGDCKSKYIFIATFKETSERDRFHTLLTGAALEDDERVIAKGSVKAFDLGTANDLKHIPFLQTLDWQSFRFINKEQNDLQGCKTVLSEQLRIILEFKYGIMTDRINVGPGELKLRLDLNRPHELKVLRQPQLDMTLSVESQAPKELSLELTGILKIIKEYESARAYIFPSMTELHLFQAALTGFEVLFDGIATSFNISRRRMVVPIYKKWDAAMTRVQVIQKEKIVQLVAFFENFSHGDCMHFTLRSTDVFESSIRGGKYSLRIVDAKFSLPKISVEGSGFENGFVCLDMPEYPGEHDDISIHFDSETALKRFMKSLPAPVKYVSGTLRMGSTRK